MSTLTGLGMVNLTTFSINYIFGGYKRIFLKCKITKHLLIVLEGQAHSTKTVLLEKIQMAIKKKKLTA